MASIPRTIEDRFHAAIAFIQSLPKDSGNSNEQPTVDEKLKVYGFYKQATEGPCRTSKPSFFDVVGKAKWNAWSQLGDMSRTSAQSDYIECVVRIASRMKQTASLAAKIRELDGTAGAAADRKEQMAAAEEEERARQGNLAATESQDDVNGSESNFDDDGSLVVVQKDEGGELASQNFERVPDADSWSSSSLVELSSSVASQSQASAIPASDTITYQPTNPRSSSVPLVSSRTASDFQSSVHGDMSLSSTPRDDDQFATPHDRDRFYGSSEHAPIDSPHELRPSLRTMGPVPISPAHHLYRSDASIERSFDHVSTSSQAYRQNRENERNAYNLGSHSNVYYGEEEEEEKEGEREEGASRLEGSEWVVSSGMLADSRLVRPGSRLSSDSVNTSLSQSMAKSTDVNLLIGRLVSEVETMKVSLTNDSLRLLHIESQLSGLKVRENANVEGSGGGEDDTHNRNRSEQINTDLRMVLQELEGRLHASQTRRAQTERGVVNDLEHLHAQQQEAIEALQAIQAEAGTASWGSWSMSFLAHSTLFVVGVTAGVMAFRWWRHRHLRTNTRAAPRGW